MSIDDKLSDALFDYCIAWRDRASAVQDRVKAELRAAVEQHVAEAVKAEREAIEKIAGDEIKSLLDTAGMLYSRQEFVGYERHSAQAQALMKLQEAIRERGTP